MSAYCKQQGESAGTVGRVVNGGLMWLNGNCW